MRDYGSRNSSSSIQARVNDRIRAKDVRLIGAEGEQVGIVAIAEALKKAVEAGLDLVEIAPQANPPVCRVMDYAKFLYAKEKQERENRQHQRQTQLKELRFRPQIDDHDYQTKLKSLVKFLKRGNKVKVTLVFRGREMAHQEFGRRLLDRLQVDIAVVATVERPPMQEGRFIFMTLTPK
ncbi:MAG: translation initiation factor IF-3 [Candidatus Omnitrophota bacterium]|nr:translation initiation factor IF-3 [Candidatus Omnitrophota bacterium]